MHAVTRKRLYESNLLRHGQESWKFVSLKSYLIQLALPQS